MEVFYRSILTFIVLFIILKLLGKKQIKHLTLYDYVIGITIGSIAGDGIISLDTPLYYSIFSLIIFGIIGYIFSYLAYKSHKTEELMDGEPLILYNNNEFIYNNLSKAKISIAKILESCRLKNCFDLNELECAILEPSGDISILLKNNYLPLTSNNVNKNILKKNNKKGLNYYIIIDGVINEEELKRADKSKTWLQSYLKKNDINAENVSLLYLNNNDKITLFYDKKII